MIKFLCQLKVNLIALNLVTLISQALNDLDICHKEFKMILNGKDEYENMKYNLISENGDEKQEIIKLSSI